MDEYQSAVDIGMSCRTIASIIINAIATNQKYSKFATNIGKMCDNWYIAAAKLQIKTAKIVHIIIMCLTIRWLPFLLNCAPDL